MVFQATSLSDLDSEILDNLPLDIRDKIMAGEIDKLPDNMFPYKTGLFAGIAFSISNRDVTEGF